MGKGRRKHKRRENREGRVPTQGYWDGIGPVSSVKTACNVGWSGKGSGKVLVLYYWKTTGKQDDRQRIRQNKPFCQIDKSASVRRLQSGSSNPMGVRPAGIGRRYSKQFGSDLGGNSTRSWEQR